MATVWPILFGLGLRVIGALMLCAVTVWYREFDSADAQASPLQSGAVDNLLTGKGLLGTRDCQHSSERRCGCSLSLA